MVFLPNSEDIVYAGLSDGSIHCYDLRQGGKASISSISLAGTTTTTTGSNIANNSKLGNAAGGIMDMEMSRDGTMLSVAHNSHATFLTLTPTPSLEILLQ